MLVKVFGMGFWALANLMISALGMLKILEMSELQISTCLIIGFLCIIYEEAREINKQLKEVK